MTGTGVPAQAVMVQGHWKNAGNGRPLFKGDPGRRRPPMA